MKRRDPSIRVLMIISLTIIIFRNTGRGRAAQAPINGIFCDKYYAW